MRFNKKYKPLFFLIVSFTLGYSSGLSGQPDRAAYLWRQGMITVAQRGISFCQESSKTVQRYLKFAKLAEDNSAMLFREFSKYKDLKIPEFQVAQQRFRKAAQHYRTAIETFDKGAHYYSRVKASSSRATDDSLPRLRNIVKRQIKDANTAYKRAKEIIVIGNRSFNAGNRYFNQAIDETRLKTDEELKKRLKFHLWPSG